MVRSIRKYLIASILVVAASDFAFAQDVEPIASQNKQPYIQEKGEVDIFCGVDVKYRDIYHNRLYDFLVNVTPGVKWTPGKHTKIEAQAWIPVVNQYGKHYRIPRVNILTASHEMKVLKRLALKPSIGIFSQERWGMDVKAMYPLKEWIAFEAEVGVTGYLSTTEGWQMSKLSRCIFLPGIDFYIPTKDIQLRIYGGRFLHDDTGVVIETMRHFRHYTIEAYAEYSSKGISDTGLDFGIRLNIALPPYHRSHKRVSFRPASTFCFSNDFNADMKSNRVYETSPEQNNRVGWFSPDIFFWGHNKNPDVTVK